MNSPRGELDAGQSAAVDRPRVDADLGFLDLIGLKEHLSPTRSNGLVAMINQMRYYAMAWKAKTQSP